MSPESRKILLGQVKRVVEEVIHGVGDHHRDSPAGLAGGGAKGVTAAGVSPLAGGSPLAGVSKAPTAPGGALGGAAGGAGSWGS